MNDTSAFDPQSFLDAQITEVNEKRPPLRTENPASPDGFYIAQIGEPKTSNGIMEKGERAGQPWLSISLPLSIEVPQQLQQEEGLPPKVTITDRVFIDLTPTGGIDNAKGKNRGQRNYRDALGMNKVGEPFSWRMVQGRHVKVKISHEVYEGNIQERISGVFPV